MALSGEKLRTEEAAVPRVHDEVTPSEGIEWLSSALKVAPPGGHSSRGPGADAMSQTIQAASGIHGIPGKGRSLALRPGPPGTVRYPSTFAMWRIRSSVLQE